MYTFCTAADVNYSDAFAGGFVAGIVEGKPLEQCIDMGHWLASLSIKELGPQYVFPVLSLSRPSGLHAKPTFLYTIHPLPGRFLAYSNFHRPCLKLRNVDTDAVSTDILSQNRPTKRSSWARRRMK